MIPTRRLAVLLALAAPLWLLSSTAALLAAGLILLLSLIDRLAIPGPAQLRVQREAPATVGLGDHATLEYRVASTWPARLSIDLFDALVAGIERAAPAPSRRLPYHVGHVRLPARGQAAASLSIVGRERGEYALAPVVLRIRGPLGLIQHTQSHAAVGSLAVTPSIAGVRRYRLLALQHRLRDAGVRTIRRRGEGTSFVNLREYAPGDDPRHIDWKASARRTRLITREFSVEQGQTVVIAIDAGRMMTQLVDRISRFEYALTAATVLADVALRSGDHVALIVFNDEVRAFVPPAKGAFALERLRAAMLPLHATMVEPDYAGAFRTLAARHRKRSLIVLFTDVVDPRASRSLIAYTVRSAIRHLPLVVALQNDELVTAALPRADGDRVLYENAAAEELLLERHAALTRMRSAGVSVLDISPHTMTAAVVNRYLAIKARAAL